MRFDLIVANPPYVSDDDPHLQQNGLPFEPQMALTDGVVGGDGLACIRLIWRSRKPSAAGWLDADRARVRSGSRSARFAARGRAA
jgi:release factor glutamine methyltransferase